MLRASLLRPLASRQFSVSCPAYSATKPPAGSTVDADKARSDPPSTDSLASSQGGLSRPLPSPSRSGSALSLTRGFAGDNLRQWRDQAVTNFRARADDFTASAKTTFSELGLQLNKVTGYEAIETLKRGVVEQEARMTEVRQAAREAKTAYEQAVAQRSLSQREVNDLLQRKSNWTDHDVGRFTTLVRQDHLFEQAEARAKARVDGTEDAVEREFSQLMRTILARYHEEQVWSDKIRSASTYGSLAALGLNMLVFVIAIVVVEPWKRRRLAQTFEKKIEEMSEESEERMSAGLGRIWEKLDEQEKWIIGLASERSVQPTAELVPTVESESGREYGQRTAPVVIDLRWEYIKPAAVGAGAFVAGVVSCMLLLRG